MLSGRQNYAAGQRPHFVSLHTDNIVAVNFYKILPRFLSKHMILLHVVQGFDILGNCGLKFEHRYGIIVNGLDCPAGIYCILSQSNCTVGSCFELIFYLKDFNSWY